MLKIKQFVFGPFAVNTYIVYDPDTHEAIVVDPGMCDGREQRVFDKYIDDNKLKITHIVNTHMHIDHCLGDNYVRYRYGAKVHAHMDDAFLGEGLTEQAKMFGLNTPDTSPVYINVPLREGDIIKVGKSGLEVIHIPGHSPGSIALYCRESNFAIVGDILFRGSMGRTDLPGGDFESLVRGIRRKLMPLPSSTLVLPGHDISTTIGQEKAANPYLHN